VTAPYRRAGRVAATGRAPLTGRLTAAALRPEGQPVTASMTTPAASTASTVYADPDEKARQASG